MGYHLNRLIEPVLIAVSKPLLTEFGIHHRLESCVCDTESERVIPQIYHTGPSVVIKVCA